MIKWLNKHEVHLLQIRMLFARIIHHKLIYLSVTTLEYGNIE